MIIVNDFCKPLGIKLANTQLSSTRFVSLAIGTFSVIIALTNDGTSLELWLLSSSFYMPIVTMPFIMAILGFRTSGKSVVFAMITGIATVLMWDYVFKVKLGNSVPIGMLTNLIALISSHYLLRQPGGWVGIKNQGPLLILRKRRALFFKRFWKDIGDFDILVIFKNNCPKGDGLISTLGFFVMIVTFSSVNWIPVLCKEKYSWLLDFLYPITLLASSGLISYPLWLSKWKQTAVLEIVWNLIMFCVLICFSFIMVLISNFSDIQLLVFLVNLTVILAFTRWQWGLFLIVLGIAMVTFFYQQYIVTTPIEYDFSSQFKIVYLLLLFSSSLVLFLKPKQEEHELVEEKAEYLSVQVNERDEEISKSLALKYEFLRNLEHEGHTPITGVACIGDLLYEHYDKFSDQERKDMIGTMAKSADRLLRFVDNIIDVSKLTSMNYHLNKSSVNLSELVYERLNICKKLYLNNKELNFLTNIHENIQIGCDKHYISSTVDNLIINAIQYSKESSTITIHLNKTKSGVKFTIMDQGIGIPRYELNDIFGEFVIGSKTKTPAGGRGVGLALCKSAIEAHYGKIWAESDGVKGATFVFTLADN